MDKIENIFRVMHGINVEGVEFSAYQLKRINGTKNGIRQG